jgi:lipopolysaccharide transport system ATP-binding protein
MTTAPVEAAHLWKAYRRPIADVPLTARLRQRTRAEARAWAVRDVSFDVERGHALALIGSNGSGKSTLLRMLAGVTTPTQGTVRLDGRVNALMTLGDGFHPLLTGAENALAGAMLSGMTRREALDALEGIAAFASLEAVMDQPVREYSDGMRMRLAFATAMAIVPDVLLIDEVLAVGDLTFRERCMGRLDELRSKGVTMVFVSHDLVQVERLCDRALWLLDGQVMTSGTAKDVVATYEEAMMASMAGNDAVALDQEGMLRLGTQQLEITDVRLSAAGVSPAARVRTGAALAVHLRYATHEPIDAAVFMVSIHTEQGERCLDVSTQGDDVPLVGLDGAGEVTLHLDRLDLREGRYRIDVGVYDPDWSTAFDYWWRRLPLEVHGRGANAPFSPPRHWQHVTDRG